MDDAMGPDQLTVRASQRSSVATALLVVVLVVVTGSSVFLTFRERRSTAEIRTLTSKVAASDATATVEELRNRISELEKATAGLRATAVNQAQAMSAIDTGTPADIEELRRKVEILSSDLQSLLDCVNVYMDTVAAAGSRQYQYSNC